MNTIDLKKNTKEELIIYIEKLSRDMTKIQEENLMLRRKLDTIEQLYQNDKKINI
jgi:hypothetical protein